MENHGAMSQPGSTSSPNRREQDQLALSAGLKVLILDLVEKRQQGEISQQEFDRRVENLKAGLRELKLLAEADRPSGPAASTAP